MRTLILTLILAFAFVQPGMADDVADVQQIVDKNITLVIDYVKDKSLPKEIRNQKILDTVNPFFDFDFMAMVCLEKKHRKKLSAEQKKQFVNLFVQQLQGSFLEKLDLYTDEDVVVEKAKRVKKRIHALTYLVSKGDKMELNFKFRKTKRGWKVYDLEVLGVSTVLTYRSQFSGFLKKNSMDDLLKKLSQSGYFTMPTGEEKK